MAVPRNQLFLGARFQGSAALKTNRHLGASWRALPPRLVLFHILALQVHVSQLLCPERRSLFLHSQDVLAHSADRFEWFMNSRAFAGVAFHNAESSPEVWNVLEALRR